MVKNQKGITLIALVITIIVLLILAGVSIAMLTGENGILTQAGNAKSETNKAEAVERINLALNAVKSEIYNKQVAESSYEPISGNAGSYTLDGAISTILGKDTFGTTNGSDKYYYSLNTTSGLLTLSYYNTTTEVGTASAPIQGTIDLSAAPYTIVEAK